MTATIKPEDYLINNVDLLTTLRKDLGIKSWDQMAVSIDLSSSNLYDHVYTKTDSKREEKGLKPVYEKLFQLWHIKLFTALNYLNQQFDDETSEMLDLALKPLAIPNKVPNSVTLTDADIFTEQDAVIRTPKDLKNLAALISEGMGVKDPILKRGPGNGRQKDIPLEDQFPLTNLMANISGISFRTYNSYAKAPNTEKGKKMKGMLSKIYTLAHLFAKAGRFDIIQMMADINEDKHTDDYGEKRHREPVKS